MPDGTKSLALICEDPDAPMFTWVHWIVYRIPPTQPGLKEAVPKTEILEGGIRQGKNSWRRLGYGGPCPPPGRPHRYFFRLYALDMEPELAPGADRSQLEAAMKGHIIAKAETMGVYART